MKTMQTQIEELLNIYAPSGKETPVRNYLFPILSELMDHVKADGYSNLLGVKKCGTGQGATILLSAHMDTVSSTKADKKIINNNGVYTAITATGKRTVLGADDRAGIAVVLMVLRNIPKSFNGTIKVAFSREEEIGCVGASKISKKFYKDVDLAIICDRKGRRDIVTGCINAFCADNVGNFFEYVSDQAHMDYACVEGGVSDAVIFSNEGINSVNLSVGYYAEHTSNEILILKETQDTCKLIIKALELVDGFYRDFDEVPAYNAWVEESSYYKQNAGFYSYSYDEDYMWIEAEDKNGSVYAYEFEDSICIQQNDDEIRLDAQTFHTLVDAILTHLTKRGYGNM